MYAVVGCACLSFGILNKIQSPVRPKLQKRWNLLQIEVDRDCRHGSGVSSSLLHILFFFFLSSFFQLYCPIGISPIGNSDCFPMSNQPCHSQATQSREHAGCFSGSIIHRTLTRTTGSLTCLLMLMRAIAHGGVRTPLERLPWKWTFGEKSIAASGNWTCISGVSVWRSTCWLSSPPCVRSVIMTSRRRAVSWQLWNC